MKLTKFELSEKAWQKQNHYGRVIADLIAIHKMRPSEKTLANYELAKKIWLRTNYGIK